MIAKSCNFSPIRNWIEAGHERYLQDFEIRLAYLKHKYSLEYEKVRATAAFEHAAVRPLFLLNGGALIAYLALYGALSQSQVSIIDWGHLVKACTGWTIGLVLAVIATYFLYLSQFNFRKLRGREARLEELELGISKLDDIPEQREIDFGNTAQCMRKRATVIGSLGLLLFIMSLIFAFLSVQPLST